MVTHSIAETRKESAYALEAVHRLAGFGQVLLLFRRVQRHVQTLGMGIAEVCACLSTLDEACFQRSERYEDDVRWHDVYLLPSPTADEPQRRLYIKLRLDDHCIVIELCSFHPEGWL